MKESSANVNVRLFAVLLIMIATVIGSSVKADPMPKDMKSVKLIFATYDARTADGGVAVSRFMDNITKRTNGLVKFRRYFSSGLVGPKEIFTSITSNVVQIGYTRTMYYPGKFKLCTIDELPFTGYLMNARQKAYMDLVNEFPELKAEFSKQKLKLLTPLQSTAPNLASRKPILTVNDWRNVKIRAGGTGAILVQAWGGIPVNIATANVYESISRGLVEGVYGFPPATMIAYGYNEVAKYFIDTGTGALGMLTLVINQNAYKKFPPEVQKIFEEEARDLGEYYPKVRMEGMRRAIPKAIASGVRIVRMPKKEQAKLLKLGRAEMHEKWIKGLVDQGYNEALLRKMLKRLLALYNKYAKKSDFVDFWGIYEKEFKK